MQNDLAIIAAMTGDRVIGAGAKLPWHLPEDLKYFRRKTLDHVVIMGRRTYESIGRPLPRRTNIVLSRTLQEIEGCHVYPTLESALAMAWALDECPFVIGGAAVYAEALPLATRLYITEVHLDVEGDVYFPEVDWSQWSKANELRGEELTFNLYTRS